MKNVNVIKLVLRDSIFLLLFFILSLIVMPWLNIGFSAMFIIFCYTIPMVYYILLYTLTYVCIRKNRFIKPFYTRLLANIPFSVIVLMSIVCFFFMLSVPHGSKLEDIKNEFAPSQSTLPK